MKSYKCKGSFLIDSMAGFLLIGLITLLLIPMMNQMQASINHKLQSIDASKVILTTVSKINKEELKKGVTIGKYDIKQSDQQICAISKIPLLIKDMYTVLMSKLFRLLKC